MQKNSSSAVSVLIFSNYRMCQSSLVPLPTSTKGPSTTTEVRNGMNLCDPLMKPGPRNGYEINFVICEAHEICQPLSSNGDLAEVGYSF